MAGATGKSGEEAFDINQEQKPRVNPAIHFMAGGVGGTLGAIVTCPLEVVKTRLQSSIYRERASSSIRSILTEIYRTEGVKGLWRGIGPNLIGVIPSRAVYFSTYASVKSYLIHDLHVKESPIVHLAAAATAGATTSTLTNPIWLIKTRMQLQSGTKTGVQSSPGTTAPLSSSPSSSQQKQKQTKVATTRTAPSLSFIPRNFAPQQQKPEIAAAAARQSAGLHTLPASSSSSSSLSSPSSSSSLSSATQYRNSFDCLVKVVRQEGVKGLFRGLGASYIGTIEGTMQWIVYEQLKKSVADYRSLHENNFAGGKNSKYSKNNSDSSISSIKNNNNNNNNSNSNNSSGNGNAWQRFTGIQMSQVVDGLLVAGTAKFIASLTTYPHEVLRTRLRQVVVVEVSDIAATSVRSLVRPKYDGIGHVVRQVLKEEGVLAFYGGLTAHLLRTVPNAAIMFFCYETVIRVFQ